MPSFDYPQEYPDDENEKKQPPESSGKDVSGYLFILIVISLLLLCLFIRC